MKPSVGARFGRLGLAATLCSLFTIVLNIAEYGIPTKNEALSLLLGFVFFAIVYAVVFCVLYFISILIDELLWPGWITFPLIFTALYAAFFLMSLTGFDMDEEGGRLMVDNHHLTADGWHYWSKAVVETFAIGLLADAVLFGRFKRRA